MRDEMSLEKDITWHAQSFKWIGPIDYGGAVHTERDIGELATHVLLLAFRPFKSSWVQPIRVFATKTAPGPIVAQIVNKAIEELGKCHGIVRITVCDGSSSNKYVLQVLWANGNKEGNHFFIHASMPENKAYCLIDVPHLFKCIRNNFMKHRDVCVSNLSLPRR